MVKWCGRRILIDESCCGNLVEKEAVINLLFGDCGCGREGRAFVDPGGFFRYKVEMGVY